MTTQTPSKDHIFNSAADLKDPAQRAAYLDNACRDNPGLRAEIEDLLAHDEQAGSFLEAPPPGVAATVDNQPDAERPGALIGRYKLLQELGEGGMGTVYMAEQLEPVKRRVAVKIIKRGLDSRQFIARFEAERQALALMDHPNIARVLDAGCTETGRPYFVMELVKGVPIHKFCDENKLTAQQRLRLFVSVCQAVQHAHQKGIIHRDLKPSNVLVALYDDRPVPKIIDFGVAKAAHQQLTEKTLFTQIGQIVGTWEYMSPEQAVLNQLDVDTRTDIYSLGVILYELLTGVTPLESSRLRSAALDEMLRLIREEEPPKPSTRVSTLGDRATASAAYRGTNAPSLAKTLRGDLDWIVMKSLEKNRARRYDTAKDLADDVQRYLTHQPVEARAPSTLYRLRRFVRRYRGAAATVAAIAATLIAATVFSTWMAIQAVNAREQMQLAMEDANRARQTAEEEAAKKRKAADDAALSLEIIGAALGGGEGTRLGSSGQTAVETLDSLARRLDTGAERNFYIEANLRPVIGKAYWDLLKHEKATVQFRLALEAQRRVYGAFDAKTTDTLSWLLMTSQATGDFKDSDHYVQELVTAGNAIGGREGGLTTARALAQLADCLGGRGNRREALDVANKSYALFREHGSADSSEFAWAEIRVAEFQGAIGDNQKQVAGLREALRIFERINDKGGQWEVWMRLGRAFSKLEKLSDAKDAFGHAIQLAQVLSGTARQRWHESTLSQSEVLFKLRDWQGAETIHRQFLRVTEPEVDKNDPRLGDHRALLAVALTAQGKSKEAESIRPETLSSEGQVRLRNAWVALAGELRTAGKNDEAARVYAKALGLWEQLSTNNPANASYREELANSYSLLGEFLEKSGQSSKAEQAYRHVVELHERVTAEVPTNAGYCWRLQMSCHSLARLLESLGRAKEAKSVSAKLIARLRESLATCERLGDANAQSEMWRLIGDELRYQGSLSDAKDAFGRAFELYEGLRIPTEDRVQRQLWATGGLFNVLADLRDWQAAEAITRQFLHSADGRIDKTKGEVVFCRFNLAWALEEQGKDKELESTRLELLSDVQRAVKEGKTVWGDPDDRILAADLTSATKNDEASLQEALRILKEVEKRTNEADSVKTWWHAIYMRIQKKLGHTQDAIQHARLSVEKCPSDWLYTQHTIDDQLIRLLRDGSQFQEAETALRKALDRYKVKFGDDHVITNYARADLAEFLVEVKKYAEAEGLLQQAEKGILSDQRVPASQRQRVVGALAKLYEAWGKPDQATAWRAKRDAISTPAPSASATKTPDGK